MVPEDRSKRTVDGVLADYFTRRDNGEDPSPNQYLRRYPELSAELLSFFRKEGLLSDHLDFCGVHAESSQFADYKIHNELGRGGLGVVYRASHLPTGNQVALKLLSMPAAHDTKHVMRFETETITLRQLDHPHIVKVLGSGHNAGAPYYAMQLIDGKNLRDWIADLDVEGDSNGYARKICRMLQPIADALVHSHELGILHRDIKPSNILIDENDKAYLVDFGLARLPGATTLTMTGDVVGTLRYASPEQIAGERTAVDERTDIYSLGATLWEALARRPVVASDDRRTIIHDVLSVEPITTRSVGADTPYDADTIALRCLAKEPMDRYQSASDLSDDLRRFTAGEPIRASRPSMSELTLRWARRNHKLMTASLLGMALLTLFSLTSFVVIYHAKNVATFALAESNRHQKVAQQNEEKTLRLLYVSDMQNANDAWHAGNWAEMNAKLDGILDYDPECKLRRVAWNLLKQQGKRQAEALFQSESSVYTIAYSPCGKLLHCGCADGMIRIRDAVTGAQIYEFQSGQHEVNHIVFSPDGSSFASAGDDGTVKLWRSGSYELIREFSVGSEIVWTCAFSDDGERLLTTGSQSFLVFRVSDGALLDKRTGSEEPRGVRLIRSMGANRVLTAQGLGLRSWTVTDEKATCEERYDVSLEEGGYVTDMCLSEEDEFVITSHRNGRNVVVRDLHSFEPIASDSYVRNLNQLVLFPKKGVVVGSTAEGDIRVLELTKENGIVSGTRFVSGWVEPREPLAMLSSPDQLQLVYSVKDRVFRIDLAQRLERKASPVSEHTASGYIVSTPYSANHATVTPTEIRFGPGAADVVETKSVDAAVSSDGERIAAITPGGHICVWNTQSKELCCDLVLPNQQLNRLEFCPSGKRVLLRRTEDVEHEHRGQLDWNVVESKDALYVFDLDSKKISSTGDTRIAPLLALDHGNRFVYLNELTLVCRDASTLEVLWKKSREIDQVNFSAMTIHPKENLLAVATFDGQFEIINTVDGSVVESHRLGFPIISMAWDAAEERFYMGVSPAGLLILDSQTYRQLAMIPDHCGVGLSLIDSGRKLAFCRAEGCKSILLPRQTRFHGY